MTALRRALLLLFAAGLAGMWLRRRLAPPPPALPALPEPPRLEAGPPTEEMDAVALPLADELAFVNGAEPHARQEDPPQPTAEQELATFESAEPEVRRRTAADAVDIVDVVDDLLGPAS